MNAVEFVGTAARVVAAAIGGYVIVLNWVAVLRRRSWIPVIGGAFLVAVAVSLPATRQYWWVPLIADFGTLPGIAWTVVNALRKGGHDPRGPGG